MQWEPAFSVEIDSLDAQHRGLFAVIEELRQHLQDACPDNGVHECLARLASYAKAHFILEEAMMAAAAYPALAAHRQAHDLLCAGLDRLNGRFLAGEAGVREDLYAFLVSDWLIAHILSEDKAYVASLKAHFGANAAPPPSHY